LRKVAVKAVTRMGPENELLLGCSRTYMDLERAQRVRALVQENLDWDYLISIALQHGVMPLLYSQLSTVDPEAVPSAALKHLRSLFVGNALHNVLLTEELLKLLTLFEAHGIPAIPYKGPVLAAFVYGNLSLRQFGDLDILVRDEDYQRAKHLLLARDYQVMGDPGDYWETTFVDGSGKVVVDLHKAMTPPHFPCPLDFEYLSARLQRIALTGTEVSNLSAEDTLLMLAIQITKDTGTRFLQLVKICDIAELLRVCPRLDLVQALKQARKLGCERMLQFSLSLTNSLLGTVLSQDILREKQFHPSVVGLTRYAQQQLFVEGDHTFPDQRIDQFRWRVRERLREKLCPYYVLYFRFGILVPNEKDRALLRLPTCLSFLYYLLRPIRLFWHYGLHRERL
jgi:hypothetical protein